MNTCYTNGTTNNNGNSVNGYGYNGQYGAFSPPTNSYFPNTYPNGYQSNGCPDFSGNAPWANGTTPWSNPVSYAWTPSGYAQHQTWNQGFNPQFAQGFNPNFNASFQSGFQPNYGQNFHPGFPYGTNQTWNGQNWNGQPWGFNTGWNTPWCNTPNAPFSQWTNQWSTPWSNPSQNQWNSPWNQQWNQQWGGPMNQPTNPWNATNNGWCNVPTITPWGLCFTTVPTSVYANLLATCASNGQAPWTNSYQNTPWNNTSGWNNTTAWPTQNFNPTNFNPQNFNPQNFNSGWQQQPTGFGGTPWNMPNPMFNRAPYTPNPFGTSFPTQPQNTPPTNYSNTGKPFPTAPNTGAPTAPATNPSSGAPAYGSPYNTSYGVSGTPGCGPNGLPSPYGSTTNQCSPTIPESGCCSGICRNAA